MIVTNVTKFKLIHHSSLKFINLHLYLSMFLQFLSPTFSFQRVLPRSWNHFVIILIWNHKNCRFGPHVRLKLSFWKDDFFNFSEIFDSVSRGYSNEYSSSFFILYSPRFQLGHWNEYDRDGLIWMKWIRSW